MNASTDNQKDAVLLIAFGGPECLQDVRPFLTQVTQGRVPQERLEGVARHYELFDGKSPVNEVTCCQADALKAQLEKGGRPISVYVGMRNWHPFLADTLKEMARDGIRSAVAMIMSVFQSTSSWDQYQADVSGAITAAGIDLTMTYTPPFFDQPGFIKTMIKHISDCRDQMDSPLRDQAHVLFTAHSLPRSDPQAGVYEQQVSYSAARIAAGLQLKRWHVAYQSRSGRPTDPWLEPDVNDVLKQLTQQQVKAVTVAPIGFVCDNIEVLYDLDIQLRQTAEQEGISLNRAQSVGTDPEFIQTMTDMVHEALDRHDR